MKKGFFLPLLSLIFLVLLSASCYADVPQVISFQGRIVDANGQPLADGNYSMTFKIWDALAAGSQLWTETQGTVSVTNGLFSVLLGSVTSLSSLTFNQDYWLEITVGASTYSPRQRITSSAFALNVPDLRIGTTKIADNAVTTAKIADNAVTDAKVVDALTISGGTVNNTPVGQTTAAAGSFTTLSSSSTTTLNSATTIGGQNVCLANGTNCSASAGGWTLNAPYVYITTGTNSVGIGTATPGQKLDVSGGSIRTDAQLISTVATGTAPLAVSSTTKVANLNVDYLNGVASTGYVQIGPASSQADATTNSGVFLNKSGVSGNLLQLQTGGGTPTDKFVVGYNGIISTASVNGTSIVDGTVDTADLATGAVNSSKISDGTIMDVDVSATAAINWSKISCTTCVATGNIADSAVTNAKITAMDWSKLQNFPSACSAGQYVSAVGGSLTCSTPTPTSGGGWTDNGTWINLVTSTDSVTIGGTSAPSYKLEVAGTLGINSSASPDLVLSETTVQRNGGDLTLDALNAAANSTITLTNSNATYVANVNLADGVLQTNGTTRLDNSGNLSNIGTVSSTYLTTAANYVNAAGASTTLNMNGTTIVDASRNLTNIGTVSSTYLTTAANYVNVAGASTTLNMNGTTIVDASRNISNIANFTNTGNTTLGDAGTDTLTVYPNTTTLTGNASKTLDVGPGAANTTLTVTNSGAGTASLSVEGNLTVSGGTTTLNNGTLNKIVWGTNGVAVPGANSAGTKLVLYGDGTSASDYMQGIEGSTMWFNTGSAYKWYEASAIRMTLATGGNLSTTGTITAGTGLYVGANASCHVKTFAAGTTASCPANFAAVALMDGDGDVTSESYAPDGSDPEYGSKGASGGTWGMVCCWVPSW